MLVNQQKQFWATIRRYADVSHSNLNLYTKIPMSMTRSDNKGMYAAISLTFLLLS